MKPNKTTDSKFGLENRIFGLLHCIVGWVLWILRVQPPSVVLGKNMNGCDIPEFDRFGRRIKYIYQVELHSGHAGVNPTDRPMFFEGRLDTNSEAQMQVTEFETNESLRIAN